jgi:chitin synthase
MAQSGGTTDLVRRRSIQSNRSEALKGPSGAPNGATTSSGSDGTTLPTDEELLMEIRHILSTSDLMTITKKKVRQQLGKFFGVDLSSKKDYIHECIDSILKGEL